MTLFLMRSGLALALWWTTPLRAFAQPCALDPAFNSSLTPETIVYAVATQTNGQVLIGGVFQSIGGEERFNVARLNHDGSLDLSFDPGTVADVGYVSAITVQDDGKILIGGAFASSSAASTPYLTRLNTNGTVDESFNQNLSLDGALSAIVLQPDTKIVIAGSFNIVNNFLRQLVARLHSDGTLDTNFDACVASSEGATSLTLLEDGKFLMTGGSFSFSTGFFRNGLARLLSNGNLDNTYASGPGIDAGNAYTLAVRTNGHVILGGDFSAYDFTARSGIVQLDPDGTVDTAFDPGTGLKPGTSIFAMLLQGGGKLLIGGNFSTFNGVASIGVARLLANGHVDDACDAGFGANNTVSSFARQSDGKVVVGGLFTTFNEAERNGVARIKGDSPALRLDMPSFLNGTFQMMLSGENGVHYVVEGSSNYVDWSSITNLTLNASPVPVIDPTSNARPMRFYRAKSVP